MVSFFLFFALRPPPRSAILLLGGRGSRVDTIVENGKGTCKNTTKGSLLVPKVQFTMDARVWNALQGPGPAPGEEDKIQMNLEVME